MVMRKTQYIIYFERIFNLSPDVLCHIYFQRDFILIFRNNALSKIKFL